MIRRRENLIELINSVDFLAVTEIKLVVELGSLIGESTVMFAEGFPNAKIYAIDPFTPGYDPDDQTSLMDMVEVERFFLDNISHFNNIVHIKEMSYDAVNKFTDESIDLLYIDANHSYDAVRRDILDWFCKVKKDGFITGHDFNEHPNLIGVPTAVKQLIGNPIVFSDTSWLMRKDQTILYKR
jgi:hypothetical protein